MNRRGWKNGRERQQFQNGLGGVCLPPIVLNLRWVLLSCFLLSCRVLCSRVCRLKNREALAVLFRWPYHSHRESFADLRKVVPCFFTITLTLTLTFICLVFIYLIFSVSGLFLVCLALSLFLLSCLSFSCLVLVCLSCLVLISLILS